MEFENFIWNENFDPLNDSGILESTNENVEFVFVDYHTILVSLKSGNYKIPVDAIFASINLNNPNKDRHYKIRLLENLDLKIEKIKEYEESNPGLIGEHLEMISNVTGFDLYDFAYNSVLPDLGW